MKSLPVVLAVIFFILGLLYGLGVVHWFANPAHPHHWSHLVLFFVLGALCLVWGRFQSNATA